ncbi:MULTISPECIES: ribonucleoside-diphosphate reductase subunit alpha [Flammeovirga]|uniref:Ribonucleoside-diphosphate reductase n=1 Tax=Flammeovirga agarivorans TaxID=2726742 RepID=A0A7X8SPB2_9BACT|nr:MULTISPECIES: ribonucleoside-diphosphate reductase subunit alpha [Flammeovirga]NLR93899.1 ribonucleoside-diphosphate reductase subunit alpha [Flammeovirga agarivorans]
MSEITLTAEASNLEASPKWMTHEGLQTLNNGYLLEGETVRDAVTRIAKAAATRLKRPDFEKRFFDAIWNNYLCPASPVWSNMGTERGLPISCFGSYVPDSIAGIGSTLAEVMMMSKIGGGTSINMSDVRPRGAEITNNGTSNGVYPFLEMFDSVINGTNQGSTRRGMLAAYLDVEHEDIDEFLTIKDVGKTIQNIFMGVTVSDNFIQKVREGDRRSREVWAKVIKSRIEKGIPYVLYKDNANNQRPRWYKDQGMEIKASNLCSEIMLPSNEEESFVCCLSSLNLVRYDEWKDTDLVETATFFLDAVMEEFIDKAKGIDHMQRAVNFAKNHRALGLGVLGWHSFLQKKKIPFAGIAADSWTRIIFKQIKEQSIRASEKLANAYGEPKVMMDTGRRNSTLLTIAPTTSNALIAGGYSTGIEPMASNYYVMDSAKGVFSRKNKQLEELLEEKGLNNDDIWKQILADGGSVQNINALTPEEKELFLTFKEINQMAIVRQAALRQQFIDQSQSLNLNFPPSTPVKDINAVMLEAHALGVKTLYYQRSESILRAQMNVTEDVCVSCEG